MPHPVVDFDFNSIKIQLKPGIVRDALNSKVFQFHKDTIKAYC